MDANTLSGVIEDTLKSGKFTFGVTGMSVVGTPSYEEWDSTGVWLRTVRESIHWWIADWVNYGERQYGERAAQGMSDERQQLAANATGWKPETVQQYARISRQVPIENRDAGLSFSHHREVADLPVDEQQSWLQKAKSGDWSTDRLRSELNSTTKKDTTCWLLVACKDQDDREFLASTMRVDGRAVKIP
jgi:hypothetical protein